MVRQRDILWGDEDYWDKVDRAYDKLEDESVEREIRAVESINEWQSLPWWKRLWYWVVR